MAWLGKYPYAVGELEAKWDEIRFTLKPNVGMSEVLKALAEFYYEYNRIAGCGATSKIYDSGKMGILLAVSDGTTIDSILMCITGSPGEEYIARFCAAGTSEKSAGNGYEQVKKFFAEKSKDLLQLGSTGEP